MISLIPSLLLLLLAPQDSFSRFTYCHEYPVGVYERQCIDLNSDGNGNVQLKRRGSDQTTTSVTLSAAGREKYLSLIAGTHNLADGPKYESKKKVANLGLKRLVLETPSETKKADFNYSDLKEVIALTTFFDGLLNQQVMASDLEIAAQYERLSIPERLDELDRQLKIGRIGDPQGLVPVLDKLIQNDRILEYARDHARQIKEQVQISK
jgi:hypothetical protein